MDKMEANEPVNNLVSKSTSQHPLLIAVIIRTILEFLPFQLLKTSRLVCQVWNNECVNILRKKSRFHIDISNQKDFAKLQDINHSKALPCHNFNITFQKEFLWTPLGNLEKTIVELDLYFSVHLKIHGNFPGALGSFPNLKILCVRQCFFNSETPSSYSDNLPFLQTILEHAPLLNKVELETEHGDQLHLFLNLLDATNISQEITSLSLIGHVDDKHLIQLSHLGLSLQHLKLYFSDAAPNYSENSLHTLLTVLADTLKDLEIRYDLDLNMTLLEFPKLGQLASLAVTITADEEEGILELRNFSYSEQLPNLKKLALDCNSGDSDQFWKQSTSVEELEINFVGTEVLEYMAENLEEFSEGWSMFPNVKSLSIICIASDLQSFVSVVTKTWPNLEKLTFRLYPSDIDRAILGLATQEYQALLESFKSGEDFVNLEIKYQSMNKQSILCSLKGLATLEFGPYASSQASEDRPLISSEAWKFTDLSCRLVLLKMECLEKIVFHDRFSIDQISEPVRCQMRNNFKRWC